MEGILFRIHRAPALNGALRPYALYINGELAGTAANGATLEYAVPVAEAYLVEKDGPFGPAVSLRGRGLCELELCTAGGYGAPNGQDARVQHWFCWRDKALKPLPFYEKLRQARQDSDVRRALTEQEMPLFIAYAFWQSFGRLMETEAKLPISGGLQQAIGAFETLGAWQTAAFLRLTAAQPLGPALFDLPAERPDFRWEITAAVHRYLMENQLI